MWVVVMMRFMAVIMAIWLLLKCKAKGVGNPGESNA